MVRDSVQYRTWKKRRYVAVPVRGIGGIHCTHGLPAEGKRVAVPVRGIGGIADRRVCGGGGVNVAVPVRGIGGIGKRIQNKSALFRKLCD